MKWNTSKCMNKMLLLYFQNATTLILNRLPCLARSKSSDGLILKTKVDDLEEEYSTHFYLHLICFIDINVILDSFKLLWYLPFSCAVVQHNSKIGQRLQYYLHVYCFLHKINVNMWHNEMKQLFITNLITFESFFLCLCTFLSLVFVPSLMNVFGILMSCTVWFIPTYRSTIQISWISMAEQQVVMERTVQQNVSMVFAPHHQWIIA